MRSCRALLAGLVAAVVLVFGRVSPAEERPALFDPGRHMRVSEVKPGMKGYGLSVFSGAKIERFDVEVISVLKNFNTKSDVVLIKCRGQNLEHTGAVAGMSGSPIFLKDETGRERMIGAFAYGWPLTKDPIAGVQPIEYMLDVPVTREGKKEPSARAAAPPPPIGEKLAWSLAQSPYFPTKSPRLLLKPAGPQSLAGDSSTAAQMRPLATPLMTAGVSKQILDVYAPFFEQAGFVPVQAGGGGAVKDDGPEPKLEPGSVMAIPMILGDMEMSAIGTTTEVVGDRVFGFGHPFNNEGDVMLPMGTGRINHVIPNLTTSFKLGALDKMTGRLLSDAQVAVAGQQGSPPPLVPIDVRVIEEGKAESTFHFEGVLHPRFTPMICAMTLAAAVSSRHDLPEYNTLDFDITMEFENGRTLRSSDRAVNASPLTFLGEIGMPAMAAAENPFERVMVKKVSATIHVRDEALESQIVNVAMPKTRYRPGETVRAFVTYKPFRLEERIMPVEMTLPADLPDGNYQLIISDASRYLQDEAQSKPFRFTAETIGEVFDVLGDIATVRSNALYVRLMRTPDGVAIGRTTLPQLPSSRRTVLLGAGRSNTTRFVSSTIKTIPTDYVMNGAAEFVVTVDARRNVDQGKPRENAPQATPKAASPEATPKAAPRSSEKTDKQPPKGE